MQLLSKLNKRWSNPPDMDEEILLPTRTMSSRLPTSPQNINQTPNQRCQYPNLAQQDAIMNFYDRLCAFNVPISEMIEHARSRFPTIENLDLINLHSIWFSRYMKKEFRRRYESQQLQVLESI